ncbi:MAG: prlF antitoxin for toxin YhaV toxin [Halanaerobiales bacterium]|nr:prlF antitoxin for toxin YhaV toxin [Halanaerobiales bacterium]
MPIARITSRGQVTIPKEIREAIGATEGKELIFKVTGGNEAVIKVKEKPRVEDLAASLNPKNKKGDLAAWQKVVDESKKSKWIKELGAE